ncbi:uncharacterized protein DUF485 [Micromonospora pisi]|uniref:Uncharacterized protein DUF485 n=1 Tax=Micromonospora pisi TaxID=589240 RepID=A0A495JL56_9ACTN|nr:DUF485 domain-containing protein [Micromonospora pisi]RKR89385.1 uncharacterized protein DUF485 [Micromonospora pisi]
MAAPIDPSPDPAAPTGLPRSRVVLAEVARQGRGPERTRTELTQQTVVGEALVRGLVRAQLALALRLSLVVAIGLGGLPLMFAIAPAAGAVKLFGVNLPWLLLGVGAFPFLVGIGWAYVRLAERNEQDFTDLVQRPER